MVNSVMTSQTRKMDTILALKLQSPALNPKQGSLARGLLCPRQPPKQQEEQEGSWRVRGGAEEGSRHSRRKDATIDQPSCGWRYQLI